MSSYPNAEALISDAALRIDQFGLEYGILIVEGPDDKRFFCTRTHHRQQVIASGGRRMLLSAHAYAARREIDGIAFLTDCDYEVALGTLTPSWDLIITHHADIEADLLDLGGFEQLVLQVVPAALNDERELTRITHAARQRAVALADVLGRIRRVAKQEGFVIDADIRHHKYRKQDSDEIDEKKLTRAVFQAATDPTLELGEFEQRVMQIDQSYNNCNGHDLVAALHHVLRDDFGVRGQSVEHMEHLLRTGISAKSFVELDVVIRLKTWEQRTGRQIIAA